MLFSRNLYSPDSSIPTSVAMQHCDLAVVQFNMTATADAIRTRNPSCKVLAYTSPIDCESADTSGIITSVPYSVANPNESWFLHKASDGTRVQHGTGSQLLNLGVAGVQSAALSHIQAIAASNQPSSGPWDGFFFDDWYANLSGFPTTTEYGTTGQSTNAFISSFQAAMAAFLDAVIPTLHGAGFNIIIGNIPFGSNYPVNSGNPFQGSKIWNYYLGSTDGIASPTLARFDGGMEESFMNGGAPATTPAGEAQQASVFKNRIGEALVAAANGKYYIGHSYSPVVGTNANEQGHRYALGAMLLATNPTDATKKLSVSIYGASPNDSNVPWYPSYANALALGAPTAGYVDDGDGTFSRVFTNGSVKVNPTGATVAGVPSYDAVITVTSAPTAPANTGLPAITGPLTRGSVLSCSTGSWSGVPAPTTFTYQWKRNGSVISGATTNAYTIAAPDLGQSITCTVTATNSQGNASATSAAVVPSPLSAGPARRILVDGNNDIHVTEFPSRFVTPGALLTASNPSWPIPSGATLLEITLVGGGGQGGGGGTNAAAAANAGGAGGGAGQTANKVVAVGSNTTLAVVIGAGGTGAGVGGASGGHVGTSGNNGGQSTITGSGIALAADGGSGGAGGPASGTGAAAPGTWGLSNGGLQTQSSVRGAGTGGASAGGGMDGEGWAGGGGGGGGTSGTTLGGGGGGAGLAAGVSNNGGTAGGTGTSGTANGVNGASAAANSGAGGAGGGGAPSGGAGGTGGDGGSGYAVIRVIG